MTRHTALTTFLVLAIGSTARAQQTSPPPATPHDSTRKWEILDNSFLIEEAFNQEAHVVQNIFSWTFSRTGEWDGTITQEWPLWSMTHQFSYTVPATHAAGQTGVGDVLLNYRYQVLDESARRPAVAPRISLSVPTGGTADGFGSGVVGLQVNVPFSKQLRDLYVHANVGWTWQPRIPLPAGAGRVNLTSPQIAASGIWRVSPLFNLMLESVVQFDESVDGPRVVDERIVTVSPGFRRGWNLGDHQIVVGAAIPIRIAESGRHTSILTYFSYELPFGRAR